MTKLITQRETAALLSVCGRTVRTLTRKGVLPHVRVGDSVRYLPSDIEAYVASQRDLATTGELPPIKRTPPANPRRREVVSNGR